MDIHGWALEACGKALVPHRRRVDELAATEVLVAVAGCGLCHTDVDFWSGRVRPRGALPLVLGHEISGTVVKTGVAAQHWQGKPVVLPAVFGCGACRWCHGGRSGLCRQQTFLGNDVAGGFATHVVVAARALTEVPASLVKQIDLACLAVVGDALSTALHAVRRAAVVPGDVVLVVGCGGVGGFGVQLARACGAFVVALDVLEERLALMREHGAQVGLHVAGLSSALIKQAVREAIPAALAQSTRKILECSGTPAGQEAAFSLLAPGAQLVVVGFTPQVVSVPLSHLMAYEATAQGVWGCPQELLPQALAMIAAREVRLEPLVQLHDLCELPAVFKALTAGELRRRAIMVPRSAAALC